MEWIKSESTIIPNIIDTTSSKTVVYLRKNIEEKHRINEMIGCATTYYEYEEAKMTKEEYAEYLQVAEAVNIRQIRADVDYIALCAGVDLEV